MALALHCKLRPRFPNRSILVYFLHLIVSQRLPIHGAAFLGLQHAPFVDALLAEEVTTRSDDRGFNRHIHADEADQVLFVG
jgi:hypothetical protein